MRRSSRYDVILDIGTLHYVFSIKDSLFNLSRMCKVGGVIADFNPVDFSDQGSLPSMRSSSGI